MKNQLNTPHIRYGFKTNSKKTKRNGITYIQARRYDEFMNRQWQVIKEDFLKNM